MQYLVEHYNYIIVIVLMMIGLYVVFSSSNMVKKLVGLSVFQTSVFLLYITLGKVSGGIPPILTKEDMSGGHGSGHGEDHAQAVSTVHGGAEVSHGASAAHDGVQTIYANPLPHVLILTAIVVGVATLAIGLALVVRTREAYGTIEDNEIDDLDYRTNLEGRSTMRGTHK